MFNKSMAMSHRTYPYFIEKGGMKEYSTMIVHPYQVITFDEIFYLVHLSVSVCPLNVDLQPESCQRT